MRWARHWRWSHAPFPYSVPTFGRDLDHNQLRITELASGGRDDGHVECEWPSTVSTGFRECELFKSSETDFSKASFDQQERPRMPWRHPVYPGSHRDFGIRMCVASGTLPREARAPGGFQGHGGSGWELWLWCGQHGGTLTEISWFRWDFHIFHLRWGRLKCIFLLTWLDSCNGWGSSFEVRRLTIQTCDGITCKRQIQIGLVSLMPLDARSPAVRSWRPCPRSILGRWQIARCLPWMCLGCRRLKQTEADWSRSYFGGHELTWMVSMGTLSMGMSWNVYPYWDHVASNGDTMGCNAF